MRVRRASPNGQQSCRRCPQNSSAVGKNTLKLGVCAVVAGLMLAACSTSTSTSSTPVQVKFPAHITQSFMNDAAGPEIDFTVTNDGPITRWVSCNIILKSPTYAHTWGYGMKDIAPRKSESSGKTTLPVPMLPSGVPSVTVSLSDVRVACGWPNAPG
jgi:hypothetical protein